MKTKINDVLNQYLKIFIFALTFLFISNTYSIDYKYIKNKKAHTTAFLSIPTTKVISNTCGITLYRLNSKIAADEVVGAQAYKFEVYDGLTTRYFESVTNFFNLYELTGTVKYNTVHTIRVAVKLNGSYGSYGTACNVSTPTPPLTNIKTVYCNTTLATLLSSMYADVVLNAVAYRYEVTNGSTVRTFERPQNYFNLSELVGGAQYNTTYSVRVQSKVEGNWTAYGPSCVVTTPEIPDPKVSTSQCNTVLLKIDSRIYPKTVSGSEGYKFEVTLGSTIQEYEIANETVPFSLNLLSGDVMYNTTYSVRVAAKVDGLWTNYGTSCNITTPLPITAIKSTYCNTTLTSKSSALYADALIRGLYYEFEVTDGITTQSHQTSNNFFNLDELRDGVKYNTNYYVRVRVFVDGNWGNWGDYCLVKTPIDPNLDNENFTKNDTFYTLPNPFETNFKIVLNTENANNFNYTIYDCIGKIVENKTIGFNEISSLNFGNNLSSGIYILHINQNNNHFYKKIIKK